MTELAWKDQSKEATDVALEHLDYAVELLSITALHPSYSRAEALGHIRRALEALEGLPHDSYKVEELPLNIRAHNALSNNSIYYINDLTKMTEERLAVLPGVGVMTLRTIKSALADRGLELQRG